MARLVLPRKYAQRRFKTNLASYFKLLCKWTADFGIFIVVECRGSRWFKVFENDANGATVFGSKEHLLEAVRSGAEVRLISGSTFGYVTSVQNLSPVGSDDVCAQCLFHISKSGFAGFQVCKLFQEVLFKVLQVQFLPADYKRLNSLTDSRTSVFECAQDLVTK